MIIGTAGHIDHGKSAVVTALTGKPMDRLAEERRRGITIDLNFAPLDLGAGLTAGVVDVPGHEDFVRTMVAGASGIDLALLVVAADEGIMPQTLEHLAILEQLRIPAGVPVVTKSDLVDPAWAELVAAELSERLGRSPVAFDAPLVVSARTGTGMEALRARLVEHAQAAAQRPPNDLCRLPVDRAFSVAGIGTVVTGTAWSGRLVEGDAVVLLPGEAGGRVRSVETHGMRLDRSVSGARTAVGISGLDREAAYRGATLVHHGSPWTPSSALDVEIALESAAPRPLSPRARIRLHLGTAEVMARVMLRAAIAPGGRGLARLALERPVVARGGDRFVLRSYSPVATIGGGRVLDPIPPRRRVLWPAALEAEEPEARLRALVERRPSGLSATVLPVLIGLPPAAANELARRERTVRRVGDHWVALATLERTAASALDVVRRHHRAHPSYRGMPLDTLRRSLKAPEDVAEAVLDDLRGTGRIRRLDGVVALAGFAPRVEGGDAEIERLLQLLESASLTPPSLAELEKQTGRRDVAAMLRLAAASGRVEPVERDRYYTRGALDRFVDALEAEGRQGDIVPSTLRQRLGISRKYLIPLLEWADGKGITVRVGDTRRLKRT